MALHVSTSAILLNEVAALFVGTRLREHQLVQIGCRFALEGDKIEELFAPQLELSHVERVPPFMFARITGERVDTDAWLRIDYTGVGAPLLWAAAHVLCLSEVFDEHSFVDPFLDDGMWT